MSKEFRQNTIKVGLLATLIWGASPFNALTQENCPTSPYGSRIEVSSDKEVYLGGVYGGTARGTAAEVSWRTLDIDSVGNLQNYTPGASTQIVGSTEFFSSHVAATGDLNGDGHDEIVQGWRFPAPQPGFLYTLPEFKLATTNYGRQGNPTDSTWQTGIDISQPQLAIGNIDGSISTAENSFGNAIESVVLGGLFDFDGRDTPVIWVLHGNDQANIAAFPKTSHAVWQKFTGLFSDVDLFSMGVGDVDLSGTDNIISAMVQDEELTIAILSWSEGHGVNDLTGSELNLETSAVARFNIGQTPERVKLAIADIDGDFRSEIIIASAVADMDDPAENEDIVIRTFNVEGDRPDLKIVESLQWPLSSIVSDNTRGLALTTGDTDRDHLAEIALAYYNGSTRQWETMTVGVDQGEADEHSDTPAILKLHGHFKTGGQRISDQNLETLQMASGDLDRDGQADLLVSFTDQNNVHWVYRLAQTSNGINMSLSPKGTPFRSSEGQFTHSPSIAVGDRNNDTIYAAFDASGNELNCLTTVSDLVSAVAFVPPYWKTLQGDVSKDAFIGQSKSSSSTTATGFTRSTSTDVSGYISAGAGTKILGVGITATATATAGYENSSSVSRSESVSSTESHASGARTSDGDEGVVVYERLTSRCFNYDLEAENMEVDGSLRFCETFDPKNEHASLEGWTKARGPGRNSNGAGPSWVPIVRDWASLALFRSSFTSQSSSLTASTHPALAVNGDVNGQTDDGILGNTRLTTYYSQTKNESQPWWQIDLGQQRLIRHVRLWNRIDTKENHLENFWVLVSQVPFGDRSLDSILSDPDIKAFRYSGATLRVADVPTLWRKEDALGQYVRIQLASTGSLSLAEVQVFGSPHMDPDRYPTAFRESDVEPGFHEVRVYDPFTKKLKWIDERGSILWDGKQAGIWNGKILGNTGGAHEWSRQSAAGKASIRENSLGNSVRFGAEFDVSAEADIGFAASVSVGGGIEFSSGFEGTDSTELSWEEGLEFGGSIANFSGSDFRVCEYTATPYTYEITDRTSSGFTQRYMVLDYIVPNDELKRSDWERYENCRDHTTPEVTLPLRLQSNDYTFDQTSPPNPVLTGGAFQHGEDLALNIVSTGPLPTHKGGEAPSGRPDDHYFSFNGDRAIMIDVKKITVARPDTGYTIEAWIRMPIGSPNAGGTIFSADEFTSFFGYQFKVTAEGQLTTNYGRIKAESREGLVPIDGNWHHVASVAEEQTDSITYYVDGKREQVLPFRLKPGILNIYTRAFRNLHYFIGGQWGRESFATGAKSLVMFNIFTGDIDRVRTSPLPLKSYHLDSHREGRGITMLTFQNQIGSDLESFYQSPRGRGTIPESTVRPDVTILDQFEIRSNQNDNYGAILVGYVEPPTTGFYRFMLHSNRDAELYFNPEGENPIAAKLIAESGTNGSLSGRFHLLAGQRYYIEASMKESNGAETLSVSWQQPGAARLTESSSAIPGRYLQGLGAIKPFQPDPSNLVDSTFLPGGGSEPSDATESGTRRNNFFSIPKTVDPNQNGNTDSITDPTLLAYWNFNDASNPSGATDTVRGLFGTFEGARFTESGAGFSGLGGDRALDLRDDQASQLMRVTDSFLNEAAAGNQITLVLRQRLDQVVNATMFHGVSNTSTGGGRGLSAHLPWSNREIYFDSAGCCSPELFRLNGSIDGLDDPIYEATEWHTYTLIKDGDSKSIWIDDKLFLEGTNTAPLPDDFTEFVLGAFSNGANPVIGVLDDVAIFKRSLTETEIVSIARGTSPARLSSSQPATNPQNPIVDPPLLIDSPSEPRALAFDGVDDYVRVEEGLVPTSGNFSIEFWFKSDPSALGSFREVLSQANVNRSPRFYIGITPQGNVRAGDSWSDTGTLLPTDDRWHHLALVRSDSNTQVFVDGELKVSRGAAIANPSAEPWMDIGQQFSGGEHWKGQIDELRIWSIARTGADISEHMNRELRGGEDALVGYYPFSEGPGSTQTRNAAANAGLNSTGTLEENPTWVMGKSLQSPLDSVPSVVEPPVVTPPIFLPPNPGFELPATIADCPKPGIGGLLSFVNSAGPVTDHTGNPAGLGVIGQVWAGPSKDSLQAICEPISVFAFGFFAGGVIEMPFPGTTAYVQLRAWSGALNRSDAPFRGESEIVQVTLNSQNIPLTPPTLPTGGFQLKEPSTEAPPSIELPEVADLNITQNRDGGLTLEWKDSIRLQLQGAARLDGPWLPILVPGSLPGNRSPLIVDPNSGPNTIAVPGQNPFEGTVFFRLVDLLARPER